jgi:hypothetical protein
MKTTILTLAVLTLACADGAADGQLKVGGQTAKLTQAYAYAVKGFFDPKQDDTVVVLTDRAVPEAEIRDGFALRRLAETGKLSYVQETINAKGQIVNYTLGDKGFKVAPSGGSTEHRFEGKQGSSISGKVFTNGVQETFGVKYEYSATFNVPVHPKE